MRTPRIPTQAMLRTAKADVTAWKASGNAARRFLADDAAAYALATLRLLATMPVAPDGSIAGKREHLRNGGESVGGDWYSILPTMGSRTAPSQGFENRLLAALTVYAQHDDALGRIGWGWIDTTGKMDESHGFVIIRTA